MDHPTKPREPRVMVTARVDARLVAEGRARAARAGLTFTDLLAAALASWLARQ